MQFSQRFKQLCKEKGVTQKQALADMDMHRNAAQSWIEGRPSVESLAKMTDYFGLSTDEILGKEQQKKPTDQMADGLQNTNYYKLNPENRGVIDALIEKLLKSQSGE